MIAVTGATGHLGRLVITSLLRSTPASSLIAIVRNPGKAADLAAKGVQVRQADYNDRAALDKALSGVNQLLLISSSEVGQRSVQHSNVVAAAVSQKVKLIVYTSLLHADTSPLTLAPEHLETEAQVKATGIPYVILRNGWYTENYTASLPSALAHGVVLGSAGNGRVSSATRADYADAAAKAVTGKSETNRTYELAGDEAYTLAELAAEISRQTGKTIPYKDLPPAEYTAILRQAGLPDWLCEGFPAWDQAVSTGALYDASRELSRLIGRPTTPLSVAVKDALAQSKT